MSNPFNKITTAVSRAWSGADINHDHINRYKNSAGAFIKTAIVLGIAFGIGYGMVKNPPIKDVPNGMIGIRTSVFDHKPTIYSHGSVLMVPGIHSIRILDLRDQVYQPEDMRFVDSRAPLQSIEGLSIGMDINVRYALDPRMLKQSAFKLPEKVGPDIVEPAVQGMIYRVVSAYTVKEIFSTKRQVIQQTLENELRKKLAVDGIALKGIQIGKVDLPENYKRGMEAKLAEELASEKMHYTLELKEKEIKETALIAEAQKVKRQKIAEAAALEQVIAAKAQQDAMKHILPFKEKQIKQRQLEAEAQKQTVIKHAEGNAKARTIEAIGEAESRQKLAEAEAFRLNLIGKVNAEQMEREGALVSKHPLLIQKAMADKLSDKIQVIIAPPSMDSGLITANLLGGRN
jgi:regulator of protease activity HflC (stomatin/prohibitin superfamily)